MRIRTGLELNCTKISFEIGSKIKSKLERNKCCVISRMCLGELKNCNLKIKKKE